MLTTTLEPNQVNNTVTNDVFVEAPAGLFCEVFTNNLPGDAGTVDLLDDADGLGGGLIITGTSRNEAIVVVPINGNPSGVAGRRPARASISAAVAASGSMVVSAVVNA